MTWPFSKVWLRACPEATESLSGCSTASPAMSGQVLACASIYPLVTSADKPPMSTRNPKKVTCADCPSILCAAIGTPRSAKTVAKHVSYPCGRWKMRKNYKQKVISIMQQIMYSTEKEGPCHGISHSCEDYRCWIQTKGQCIVHIKHSLPGNSQQMLVNRVDWDNPVSIFNSDFNQLHPWSQPTDQLLSIVQCCIAYRA